MQVFGPLADLMPYACWGCCTRVVPTPKTLGTQGSAADVRWSERFLIALPPSLSERLLSPTSNDDQFAGVPMALRFKLLAHDRPAADVLAAATTAVEFDWLVNQVWKCDTRLVLHVYCVQCIRGSICRVLS